MQNTSVGRFVVTMPSIGLWLRELAETLRLLAAHLAPRNALRVTNSSIFLIFLSVMRHLLLHLTAGCAIVVLCRLKNCLSGRLRVVRTHEAWGKRLLDLGPGHPISSMRRDSAEGRIGLAGGT